MKRKILLMAAAVLVVGACSDQENTAPTELNEGPSLAAGASAQPYVISFTSKAGDVKAAIERAGGKVRKLSRKAGLATATSSDPEFATKLLANNGFSAATLDTIVQWIDPNERGQAADMALRSTRVRSKSIGDDETFFPVYQWAPRSINAPAAWDAGARGANVRVAVLDGGLNNKHVDLDGSVDVARSASFVDGFAFNQDVDPDDFSHATHVAGIVAARDNGIGTIGIAPGATIIGVKVLHDGSGSFGAIIEGILHAATALADDGAGAHIINMSLGATFPSERDIKVRALKAALDQATTFAYEAGVLVIASAGNGDRQGRGIDHDSGRWFTLPAESDHVLSISATGPAGYAYGATNFTRLASYSNFGSTFIDFAGPGGDFSLFPDPLYFLDMVLSPATLTSTTGYFFAAGTSMSTPAVAAVAALIIEKNGLTKNPAAVEAKLRSSSDDLPPAGVDRAYGFGFVNALEAIQ